MAAGCHGAQRFAFPVSPSSGFAFRRFHSTSFLSPVFFWRSFPPALYNGVGEAFPLLQHPSLDPGDVLLSRAVPSQVPSALRGLTSVFGMGTGGSLSLLSPEIVLPCQLPPLPAPLRFTASPSLFSIHTLTTAQLLSSTRLRSSASLLLPLPLRFFPSRAFLFLPASALPRAPLLRLSPRPISIIKLHTLPHFHR